MVENPYEPPVSEEAEPKPAEEPAPTSLKSFLEELALTAFATVGVEMMFWLILFAIFGSGAAVLFILFYAR